MPLTSSIPSPSLFPSPLLRLVPRRRPTDTRGSAVRAPGADRRRAHGGYGDRARALVSPRAAWPLGGAPRWPGSGSPGRSSRSTSSCPRWPRATRARSSATTLRSEARPSASSRRSSRTRARSPRPSSPLATSSTFLGALGVPLAGLFVLAPGLAAVAVPQFLANGLSVSKPMTDPHHHYLAAIVPFLVAATVVGIARLPFASRRPFAAKLVLALSVALSLAIGAWPFALQHNHFCMLTEVPRERFDALRRAVELVPDGRRGQLDEQGRLSAVRPPLHLQRAARRTGTLDRARRGRSLRPAVRRLADPRAAPGAAPGV